MENLNLTPEQIHDLCHDLEKTVSAEEFAEACVAYQKKLFGRCPRRSYEMVKADLQEMPMTWYPALLKIMVDAAYAKKVFRPFGASRFIHQHCEPVLVHFLHHGVTPHMVAGLAVSVEPAKWPEGHLWAGEWEHVNCPDCLAVKPEPAADPT